MNGISSGNDAADGLSLGSHGVEYAGDSIITVEVGYRGYFFGYQLENFILPF